MNAQLQDYSHKRYNILTQEWVLVSPHRAKRPWQGQEEEVINDVLPSHDPNCYLCAGSTRANGMTNPDYQDVFIFNNDFAALQEKAHLGTVREGLLWAEGERGICRVVCFSPDHNKSLAQMTVFEITKVVKAWKREYKELGSRDFINYVQIFENKGAIMGCSNPHPHGQIWGQSTLPNEVVKKNHSQRIFFAENQESLLQTYLGQELEKNERIIYENDGFVILVPFWAVWPFETMVVPKKHQQHIALLSEMEEMDFADAIKNITAAYDKIFNCSFPYSSGIHQAPTNSEDNEHWHWHMSFYPPLLRSATVKKFMVGYEMFGSPQRDITAEQAVKLIKSFL
ncbi:UDP-glucose--hexose-1-phosphate uridylyltransferase [Muricauda sp. SCSIO 64092]|uniref:UDP-glucose--hexose-1-phosphate uridylyltransferase n=1 Tax=Allomuricauda sp. SCSIO 64092 TaxID=2908842 RepID=UPI001FF4B73D|nr:UDP-glucose--hexose-1-phosphate uridylyltransferase [Muricauda sp. SCSIO 64092]UOY04957.1 UDP-glucose--hexose-1-phosphate uridylyltransferase [Muricauda sp. SCSIO 64092]